MAASACYYGDSDHFTDYFRNRVMGRVTLGDPPIRTIAGLALLPLQRKLSTSDVSRVLAGGTQITRFARNLWFRRVIGSRCLLQRFLGRLLRAPGPMAGRRPDPASGLGQEPGATASLLRSGAEFRAARHHERVRAD